MLEFRKKENAESDRDYELVIDGTPVEHAYVYAIPSYFNKHVWDISTRVPAAAQQILRFPVSSYLPIQCIHLIEVVDIGLFNSLYITPKHHGFVDSLTEIEKREQKDFEITFVCEPDLAEWKKPYSFRDYCNEITRIVKDVNRSDLESKLYDKGYDEATKFTIKFPLPFIPAFTL